MAITEKKKEEETETKFIQFQKTEEDKIKWIQKAKD